MQVQKIQNNNYSTSFGAKLNVKHLNHWRWNKIAKDFEKATSEYPNDTITIKSVFGEYNPFPDGVFVGVLSFSSEINNNGKTFVNKADLSNVGTKMLTTLEDNEIVGKLVNMHKILRTSSDMFVEGNKLINTFMTKFKDSNIGHAKFKLQEGIEEASNKSKHLDLDKDNVWARLRFYH